MINSIKLKLLKLFRILFPQKQEEEKKKPFHYPYTKYKTLFSKDKPITCNKSTQELFDGIYQGDVVLAHMPLPKEKLEKIPEGHRIRPYYIAYKLKYGFIAYSFSSHNFDWLTDDKTYSLTDFSYEELTKSSFLNLYEPYYLPMDKVIKFICETKEDDFNQIQRRLWINRRQEYESLYHEKPVIHEPIPGDIINSKNNQWLVLSENGDSYECLEVCKNEKKHFRNSVYVNCNVSKWRVNTTQSWIINKRVDTRTQHIVNKDDFYNLKKIVFKTKDNKWSSIPRGALFSKKNILYYCFYSNKGSVRAYKVKIDYGSEGDLPNFVVVENDDEIYYVDPRVPYDINGFAEISVIGQLSNKYIALIDQAARKEIKAKSKAQAEKAAKKVKPKYFTKYKIGTVFKDIREDEEYIYIYSNRSYDYCVKASEYLNGEVFPEYPLYETRIKELIKTGEIDDEDLFQILTDHISYGNDKCGILSKKLKEIGDINGNE